MRRALTLIATLFSCLDGRNDEGRNEDSVDIEPADSAPPTNAALETKPDAVVAPELVHFVGRFDRHENYAAFAFSGTAIFARFEGDGVTAELDTNGADSFTVVVDGGASVTLTPKAGRGKRVLVRDLAPGLHDVAIYKRTDAWYGTARFYGLEAHGGKLVPSPYPFKHRIEIIGDSITAGVGVLGKRWTCTASAQNESEYDAWGAVAARELGAAHVSVALPGSGVSRNADGSTKLTMGNVFERTLAFEPSLAWDFSRYTPDVVVVNLGTNDFARGDPGKAFFKAYAALLAKIRAHYPSAHVVAAVGPMLVGDSHARATEYVRAAIATYANVSLLDLGPVDFSHGFGCNSHPSVATQQRIGHALAEHVRARIEWR